MSSNKTTEFILLKLFDEGKSEVEAYNQFCKTHGNNKIEKKSVSYLYEKFKSENRSFKDRKATSSKIKLTDERLIELVKENPEHSIEKLAKLAEVSSYVICNRLKQINNSDNTANYRKKDNKKFTDEFLIGLVNENPDLNMKELAKLAGTSATTISCRIKQINSNGEIIKYTKMKCKSKGLSANKSKLTDEYIIELIKENPDLNTTKLAELAGVSQSTISYRMGKIKRRGKSVNYVKKDTLKFTDEFLIDLVNKHPDTNLEKLARLAGTSRSTIKNRLKQINKDGEVINYVSKNPEIKITDKLLTSLIDENPNLNMTELANLAGVSATTISTKIKQINSDGEKLKYVSKKLMSTSKTKIADGLLIDLINNNPDLNMKELAKLADISQSTLSKRIKQINSNGEKVKYKSKKPNSVSNYSDEFIITLVNDNPCLSIKELASIANISPPTISKRIKQINSSGERAMYIDKRSKKGKYIANRELKAAQLMGLVSN